MAHSHRRYDFLSCLKKGGLCETIRCVKCESSPCLSYGFPHSSGEKRSGLFAKWGNCGRLLSGGASLTGLGLALAKERSHGDASLKETASAWWIKRARPSGKVSVRRHLRALPLSSPRANREKAYPSGSGGARRCRHLVTNGLLVPNADRRKQRHNLIERNTG